MKNGVHGSKLGRVLGPSPANVVLSQKKKKCSFAPSSFSKQLLCSLPSNLQAEIHIHASLQKTRSQLYEKDIKILLNSLKQAVIFALDHRYQRGHDIVKQLAS